MIVSKLKNHSIWLEYIENYLQKADNTIVFEGDNSQLKAKKQFELLGNKSRLVKF